MQWQTGCQSTAHLNSIVRHQMEKLPHIEVELFPASDSPAIPFAPSASFPVIIDLDGNSYSCAQTADLEFEQGSWRGGLVLLAPRAASASLRVGKPLIYRVPPAFGTGRIVQVFDV